MMSHRPAAFSCALAFAACGGSSAPSPDAAPDFGFVTPTVAVRAHHEVSKGNWTDLGPADFSCLGAASTDAGAATDLVLNTFVRDFEKGTAVAGATVVTFPRIDTGSVIETKTSGSDGAISFTLPAGTKRFGFKMTADSAMPTFLLNQYLDPSTTPTTAIDKIQTVSISTAAILPALINQTREPGTGVIAGALRDCQKHEVSGFVATLSSTSGTATPIAGADAYYFNSGVGLPVRHTTADAATDDGLFMIVQAPPATSAYVQMWGFPTDGAIAGGHMTLLAELAVPVLADTVVTGSYEPLRQ